MSIITSKKIEKMIYIIREQKVMLDSDLAELYGVNTKYLNRQVKRNLMRFPKEFMFKLNQEEFQDLRCQFVTFKISTKGRKYMPNVFTEYGVAMLSGLLNSEEAIELNIKIIKTFIKLKDIIMKDEGLKERVEGLEKGTIKLFKIVFSRLDSLEIKSPILSKTRRKIGVKK